MSRSPDPEGFDWTGVRLVAFDVDGTLYRQTPLRLRMAALLALHTVTRLDTRPLRVLSAYRRLREEIGAAEVDDFEPRLVSATSQQTGIAPQTVAALVGRWMETRPLPYLKACAYPGVAEVFAAVRRSGRLVGVLSDYPATDKIAALGLSADHVVSAGETEVGVLKPHPRGLQVLMARAGVTPDQTVLVGDRVSRDGLAARAAGARALILGKPQEGWTTFTGFDDPLFAGLSA